MPSMMVGTLMRYSFIMRDDKNSSLSDTMRIGPFANADTLKMKQPFDEPKLIVPFSRLMKNSESRRQKKEEQSKSAEDEENRQPNANSQEQIDENKNRENLKEEKKEEEKKEPTSRLTMTSTNDDFIMVDLKTPFASGNANAELGRFYRDCQTAPQLQEFAAEAPPLMSLDVTKQLESFELHLDQYDSLVESLCQSPNNN